MTPDTTNELAVAIPRDDVWSVMVVLYSIPKPEPGYALPSLV